MDALGAGVVAGGVVEGDLVGVLYGYDDVLEGKEGGGGNLGG